MNCVCGGTGFVYVTQEYKTRTRTTQDVMQARRCPSYIAYFKEHPKDGPCWADPDDWCPAATEAHRAYVGRPPEEKRKRGRWEKRE